MGECRRVVHISPVVGLKGRHLQSFLLIQPTSVSFELLIEGRLQASLLISKLLIDIDFYSLLPTDNNIKLHLLNKSATANINV